jgi:pimeloyl-ACP methyl ester carboxylesterase
MKPSAFGFRCRYLKICLATGMALVMNACALFHPIATPLPRIDFRHPADGSRRTLVVLLPGRYDRPERFAAEGFVEELARLGYPVDVTAVDAHIGYYYRSKVVPRLDEDIVAPARRAGYAKIWLVGVSMGAMGSIWYDADLPGKVDGMILLAPYLGDRAVVDEVERAGGVRAWQRHPSDAGDFQHDLWQRVKGYEDPDRVTGRLFLGYGEADGFARPDGLMARLMPSGQVLTAAGGHDWTTWKGLLKRFLALPAVRGGLDPANAPHPTEGRP